ncbi:MAG: hypothetical protein QM662_01460 [Gordonia sp. (in: high G+C Gram-positive bacteria)]
MKKTIAVTVGVAAATLVALAPGVATASPSEPTTGDTIRYEFISNHQINDSIYWYDAWGDGRRFPEEVDRKVRFNSSYRNSDGDRMWIASQTVTARSTHQLVGSYISADYESASQNYVACKTYVNGTLVASKYATGKYATAYC